MVDRESNMAVDYQGLRFLLNGSRDEVNIKKTIVFGRLFFVTSFKKTKALFKKHNMAPIAVARFEHAIGVS
jgi:hypothetical protein